MCLRKLCLIYVKENKHIFLNFILTSLSHNWQRRKSLETNFVRNQFLLAQREAVRADKLQCHSTGKSNLRNSNSCTDRQRKRGERGKRETAGVKDTNENRRHALDRLDSSEDDCCPGKSSWNVSTPAVACGRNMNWFSGLLFFFFSLGHFHRVIVIGFCCLDICLNKLSTWQWSILSH